VEKIKGQVDFKGRVLRVCGKCKEPEWAQETDRFYCKKLGLGLTLTEDKFDFIRPTTCDK
jgi:hypothetical protein